MSLDVKLIKAIWGLGRQAGLVEDELRDVVESVSRQRSIRSLRRGQALAVIGRLKGFLPQEPPQRRNYPPQRAKVRDGRVVQLVSQDQEQLIWWLLRERLDLGGKDPALYLAVMCRRMFHRDAPRTAREAGLVVGNLRRLAEHQVQQEVIPAFQEYPQTRRQAAGEAGAEIAAGELR